MAKYCSNCGAQIEENIKFCGACGNKIETTKAKTKSQKIVMVSVLIFVIITFSYVFYTFITLEGLSDFGNLTGTWEGSGTFTNNCANPACRYAGSMNPPSVSLALQQNGNTVTGTVTIDIPQAQVQTLIAGQDCTALSATGQIIDGEITSSRLTFLDPGGNLWSLDVTSFGLQGVVTNNQPGCLCLAGQVTLSRK